jgi:hypothetical protein
MPSDPALHTANLTPPPGVPGPLIPLWRPTRARHALAAYAGRTHHRVPRGHCPPAASADRMLFPLCGAIKQQAQAELAAVTSCPTFFKFSEKVIKLRFRPRGRNPVTAEIALSNFALEVEPLGTYVRIRVLHLDQESSH